jgi:hypothetical protein
LTARRIYQTLENRNNPDEIERDGPFICRNSTAWLGKGYYFWESFIENAHWWGSYCNSNGYVICEAYYDLDDNFCFNLVDNPEHIQMFRNTIEAMKREKLYEERKTAVASVIYHLKDRLNIFKYEASRINGLNSRSKNSPYSEIALFKRDDNLRFLDLLPTIQVCFYNKKALKLRRYRIVFPDEYVDGYAV